MLPLLPPMLLLLPSPLDMLDMDMELESRRDLLILRLMLLSSTDLMAMLPLLPLMDMLSPPLLSVPMLLPPLTDMEVMEVMDMEDLEPTGNSFLQNKHNSSIKRLLNSKEDLKFP